MALREAQVNSLAIVYTIFQPQTKEEISSLQEIVPTALNNHSQSELFQWSLASNKNYILIDGA